MNIDNNKLNGVIFLDLKKAFDTIFITEKLREIPTDANHESHFPLGGFVGMPCITTCFYSGI